jgi:aryl-alcohol dehydrogenase-like predicted oxidoreductase
MEYGFLGRTDTKVSRICLGTMTFGQQNNEQEAWAQLDMALDRGVNFIDVAEMYPIPPRAETSGRTEEIIGAWITARKNRDKIVLATKVVGPGERFNHIRGGNLRHNRANIEAAIDGSLKRLATDYVDLYQIHWPERKANRFGQRGFIHSEEEDTSTPIEETLDALEGLVQAGKVRHIGLSNETPWGVMSYINAAERLGVARIASVQNPYCIARRGFEVGLAEVAIRENCGLLAYSPLLAGVLSGKYLGGAKPPRARMTLFPDYPAFPMDAANKATEVYVDLAKKHGLDPCQMALSFVNAQPFLTSNIIGATTIEQLASNIDSINVKLTKEVMDEIEAIQGDMPNPIAGA